MNIFEGSRRVAKLSAGLWLVGFSAGACFGGFNLSIKSEIKEFLLALFGGLAFIGCFTVATGWVVRGFMGIPKGHDHKGDQ
jgi:hypothetical protein